jgi:hypothetical protein
MALLSLWLRDRQSVRKWQPHSKMLFVYCSFRGVNRLLPCSVSFVDVTVLNHQVLRASVGGIGSSEETGCLCKGKSTGRPRVTNDMVERVWKEFEYRLDVTRVNRGSHIEHLYGERQNFDSCSFG